MSVLDGADATREEMWEAVLGMCGPDVGLEVQVCMYTSGIRKVIGWHG